MNCQKKNIEAYFFKGPLSALKTQEMRRHIAGCPDCKAYYNQISASLSNLLGKKREELNPIEQNALWNAISQEIALPVPEKKRWKFFPSLAWASGFALILLILPLFFLLKPLFLPPAGPEFSSRGLSQKHQRIGLGLSGISKTKGEYDISSSKTIAITDSLRFYYSNEGGPFAYLFIFGVDEALTPYFYYPVPEELQSIAIQRQGDNIGRQLKYDTQLKIRHKIGKLTIYGIFSKVPVLHKEIEAFIKGCQQGQKKMKGLSQILSGAYLIHSLPIQIKKD